MTECQKILAEIELFLDQELDSGRCGQIEAHLRVCSGCSDRAEFQVHIKALVQAKCGCQDVPPDLMDRVMSHLQEDRPSH